MPRPCLVLVAMSVLVGCAANGGDEGFVVINASAAPASGGACMFTGDLSQAFIGRGQVSVQSSRGYLLFPLLESRVTAAAGQEIQRTIELHGARIDLVVASSTVTDSSGHLTDKTITLDANVTHFKELVSGSLKPGGTANVTLEIVPAAAIAQIASQIDPASNFQAVIVATIVMYGDLGGSEVDALPFRFPVNVTNTAPYRDLGVCPKPAVNKGNACNPFQDGIVDCCTSAMGGALVCPAQ